MPAIRLIRLSFQAVLVAIVATVGCTGSAVIQTNTFPNAPSSMQLEATLRDHLATLRRPNTLVSCRIDSVAVGDDLGAVALVCRSPDIGGQVVVYELYGYSYGNASNSEPRWSLHQQAKPEPAVKGRDFRRAKLGQLLSAKRRRGLRVDVYTGPSRAEARPIETIGVSLARQTERPMFPCPRGEAFMVDSTGRTMDLRVEVCLARGASTPTAVVQVAVRGGDQSKNRALSPKSLSIELLSEEHQESRYGVLGYVDITDEVLEVRLPARGPGSARFLRLRGAITLFPNSSIGSKRP